MVKKENDRWRMCTDHTDLNKACPKDPYPLPGIDRLVDGVSRYALLSFIDAYSGYNQIRIHPSDEEKTAFITEEGELCYKVMPFGLKNTGATYQCLMDKVFGEIIGEDMEVYVDDMVVKSSKAATHCQTLERVFAILRKNQLRLNPEKCSFGVRAGKFSGFMLIERGIKAKPDKCRAIIDMRSPQNEKDGEQRPTFANSASAREAQSGRTNGGLECTAVRIRHHFRKQRPFQGAGHGKFPRRNDTSSRRREGRGMVPLCGRFV
ncbi:hypothetical protein CR513_51430, partial [Mucuna pruriens]